MLAALESLRQILQIPIGTSRPPMFAPGGKQTEGPAWVFRWPSPSSHSVCPTKLDNFVLKYLRVSRLLRSPKLPPQPWKYFESIAAAWQGFESTRLDPPCLRYATNRLKYSRLCTCFFRFRIATTLLLGVQGAGAGHDPSEKYLADHRTLAPKECHVLHLSCRACMSRFKHKSFFNNNVEVFHINSGTLK